MNTARKTRIVRSAGSLIASVLVTVTVLQLIAGYALPDTTTAADGTGVLTIASADTYKPW